MRKRNVNLQNVQRRHNAKKIDNDLLVKNKLALKDPTADILANNTASWKYSIKSQYIAASSAFCPDEEEFNQLIEKSEEFWNKVSDPKNMAKHKPMFEDIDISEPLSLINNSPIENMMVIIVDQQDHKIIDYKIIDHGTVNAVGSQQGNIKALEFITQNIQMDRKIDVIFVHNHPGHVAAMPSNNDIKLMYAQYMVCKYLNVRFGDMMVVTGFDIYSQRQYDVKMRKEDFSKCLLLQQPKSKRKYDIEKLESCEAKIKPLLSMFMPIFW